MESAAHRITLRRQQPNPLFEQWLSEWLAYAELKNSLKKHSLARALDAIRRYPLVLMTGRDCCILDGFGQKICQMLDQRLQEHRVGGHKVSTEGELNKSVQTVLRLAQERIVDQKRSETAKKSTTIDEERIERLFRKFDDIDAGRPYDDDGDDVRPEPAAETETEVENIKPDHRRILDVSSFELLLLVDTQEISA